MNWAYGRERGLPPDQTSIEGELMISHRPFGSGHPYATTEDQRVPARPADGEAMELRVKASAKVCEVVCEWVTDGGEPLLIPLTRAGSPAESEAVVDGGHLAAAQARAARDASGSWSVTTPALEAG